MQVNVQTVVAKLSDLDWCKCSNCTTSTLNHPRKCLFCGEIAEASVLAGLNGEPISCSAEHDDCKESGFKNKSYSR